MSEDYLAQKLPTAIWNNARGVWEKPGTENLFCAHSELFSETWPTEGMMRNGQAYALPTPTHPTTVSESSLLRSPTASQGEGGALGEKVARERGNTVGIRDQAMDIAKLNGEKITRLPTPVTADAYTGNLKSSQHKEGSMHSMALPHVIAMLPTPTTQDGKNNAGPSQFERNTKPLNVEAVLLPTTRTSMMNGPSQKELDAGNPKHRLETVTNWGRFETAIRRWEITLGRPAPAPTKPDGKDGAHRLSSSFTEWMMGVPQGWITGVGLTRNEELKACGNGVVPQQAKMALQHLLKDVL
jgi:DNA (cytosine-5)-methyltransferase 1